ncbi:hypothetical protein CVT26_007539 [Gymnopilus dilepis]|uniref:DUF6534 domain-containing protein n=1 Tax=Gymnopilus dilepis TaxID=231916 RepID=A0A409WWL2_9AGAR|nr:hypothetical protein CVT26_007539 [Gymnopilus dilepis]
MSLQTLSPPSLDDTLGAVLVGALISTTLFGVVLMQAYTYYTQFPNDKTTFKTLNFSRVCELGQSSFICYYMHTVLVSKYGNPAAVVDLPTPLSVAVAFNGVIEPLVQGFFAYRVFVVTKRIWIPGACLGLSTLRGALIFTAAAVALRSQTLIEFKTRYNWLVTTLLCLGTALDLVVALTLMYHRTPSQRKVVYLTLPSGVLTAVTEVVMLISFFALGHTYVWVAIYSFLSKIFSISFLASLNGRTVIHDDIAFALRPTTHTASSNAIALSSIASATAHNIDTKQKSERLGVDMAGSQDVIDITGVEKGVNLLLRPE